MEFNRFDFEQQLLHTWTVSEDLQTIVDAIERGESREEIHSMVAGLKAIQHCRVEKLWDMFEAGVRDKKIL